VIIEQVLLFLKCNRKIIKRIFAEQNFFSSKHRIKKGLTKKSDIFFLVSQKWEGISTILLLLDKIYIKSSKRDAEWENKKEL